MFTKALLLLVASAGVCSANTHERGFYLKKFYDYVTEHKLDLDGAAFVKKLQHFANNVDIVEENNANTKSTYKLAVNEFAHMSNVEFREHFNLNSMNKPSIALRGQPKLGATDCSTPTAARSVDWVSTGGVSVVKDQGACGSCWSFSTTGAIESAMYNKYNTGFSMSEQHLVSCNTGIRSNHGCNGGWMDTAFEWMQSNGGICTEADYPYVSGDTQSGEDCDASKCTAESKSAPIGFCDVTPEDIPALEKAVTQQTVSIAVEASSAFQLYSSGVLNSNCGQSLDHGVLLVGYGNESGQDYWKVKNSWGPAWGDAGYIKILKSDENLCGVLEAPSYPVL